MITTFKVQVTIRTNKLMSTTKAIIRTNKLMLTTKVTVRTNKTPNNFRTGNLTFTLKKAAAIKDAQ